MPTELKERYPFSVDSWTLLSQRKRHHFLTHSHSDHTSGIESFAHRAIYCSETTRRLVRRRFPKLSRFIILEVGEAKFVSDDEQPFTVTALEANHCPGAVMLLFEGNFGNVLHTGDCRLTQDCLQNALGKYKAAQHVLDCVFLDCTFGRDRLKLPSKKEAFQQVRQCILNHPQAPVVYLACDLLGQEELLADLVAYFRTKIFVDRSMLPEYFADMMIVAPDLVTENPKSTRFHICEGFPKLYERAKMKFMHAHKLQQPEPLFIRPSVQWYTYEERLEGVGCGMILDVSAKRSAHRHRTLQVPKSAERDQFGVWHVCYSIHSSRSELKRAIENLWPKEVISTTPNCPASEVMSERAGMHHVDFNANWTDKVSKGYEEEGGYNKNLKDRAVFRPATDSRARKKACLTEMLDKEETLDSFTIVPLFGMAKHTIPPSPPLSFASTDSQSDRDFFESQTTEFFLNDPEESPDRLEEACPPSTFSRLRNSPYENFDVSGKALAASLKRIERGSAETVNREHTGSSMLLSQVHGEEHLYVLKDKNFVAEAAETVIREHSESSTLLTQPTGEENLDLLEDKENVVSAQAASDSVVVFSESNNQIRGVSLFKDATRKLLRSLHVPIPSPLPSLLDMYNFS